MPFTLMASERFPAGCPNSKLLDPPTPEPSQHLRRNSPPIHTATRYPRARPAKRTERLKPTLKSLADPTRLRPTDEKNVFFQVIGAPLCSRNKFAFDPEPGIFTLKTVLPAVMTFPYDFGFLARTLGGNLDPMDALLRMDEPVFPGIASRAIHRHHPRPRSSLFAAADSKAGAEEINVAFWHD
jgi:hypothetical protein